MKECIKCINNTNNPSIKIGRDGLCNICKQYIYSFNKDELKKELDFLKSFISNKQYDVMVGISGGKDSTAVLKTVKQLGFTPLAFTFKIGYLSPEVFLRAKKVAKQLRINHEVIDVTKYVKKTEKECFKKMADLYDEPENNNLKRKFKNLYKEGRKYYSTKCDISFPFVRPCQICRKIAIKAYYAEAQKRGIKVVIIGINEWATLKDNYLSAIRKIQYIKSRQPIYIVHLPFLLQRNIKDTKKILKELKWKKPNHENFVNTGGGSCMLARACELKAEKMLGFHIDSARLARECTIGFITKKQAKEALAKYHKITEKTVREVLLDAKLI